VTTVDGAVLPFWVAVFTHRLNGTQNHAPFHCRSPYTPGRSCGFHDFLVISDHGLQFHLQRVRNPVLKVIPKIGLRLVYAISGQAQCHSSATFGIQRDITSPILPQRALISPRWTCAA
jgi:hypothetical protein